MFARSFTVRRALTAVAITIAAGVVSGPVLHSQAGQRPMTFLDVRHLRSAGAATPSPDGQWLLYTISTPDWTEATSQTDLYLVSTTQGVSSNRQLTFTKDKNETSPRWARDGRAFFFLSNRDAPESAASRNQLYVMRPRRDCWRRRRSAQSLRP
jgi:Tol biopolymer transport system component